MDRRKFLFFLPVIALTPKVVLESFVEIGKGRSFVSLSSLPKRLTESEIIARELERIAVKLPLLFDRDSTFYSQIEKNAIAREENFITVHPIRIPFTLLEKNK